MKDTLTVLIVKRMLVVCRYSQKSACRAICQSNFEHGHDRSASQASSGGNAPELGDAATVVPGSVYFAFEEDHKKL